MGEGTPTVKLRPGCDFGRNTRGVVLASFILVSALMGWLISLASGSRQDVAAAITVQSATIEKIDDRSRANENAIGRVDERLKAIEAQSKIVNKKLDAILFQLSRVREKGQ